MNKIVFDIDGTLCEELPTFEKSLARPIDKMINLINECYRSGQFIILYTARSWSEYKMTEMWLKQNGVLYSLLLCGKPTYDLWVDDRSINAKLDINLIKEKIKNG